MTIIDFATLIWDKSSLVGFGNCDNWDQETFKSNWFKKKSVSLTDVKSPGLYWFITDLSYTEMHKVEKPVTLPESGCDIGVEAHIKVELFKVNLLPKYSDSKVVVYNGHEKNVMSRSRSHFSLNNNKTGALGLCHFNLSAHYWGFRYFTLNMVENLKDNNRDPIKRLLSSKIGRSALESAWRSKYGWPVLCKE